MDAVISGRAGRALLLEINSLKSFDVDDPSTLVSRKQSELPYLFGEIQDLRVIENADIESIQQELQHDCDFNWALDLTLISLDAELPGEIRKEAIEGLDELLADSRVAERLENILYARPLPEDGDLDGALRLCDEAHSSRAYALLQGFEKRQSLIAEVSQAWDTIPTKIFGGYDQQAEFQHVATREGLFRALVVRLDAQANVSTFLINAGLNRSIAALQNHRQVLQYWTEPFRKPQKQRDINHEVEDLSETESFNKNKHKKRKSINRASVLAKVESQKELIVENMRRREIERVHTLVNELVAFQLENGQSIFAVKSLCDLAVEAKLLGMYPLQLELTERSINIKDDDGWAWAEHGNALLNAHQLEDAIKAYEQAGAFGAGAVAKSGRAEVLKVMGRLDEALVEYEAAITAHPESVVAQRGRAEVLKTMGRLDEALIVYEAIIATNSYDVIAKSGRAEVLKVMGRLDEALVDSFKRFSPLLAWV